jgi:glycosyltransferase involved in cell wall biosynthesis
MTDPSGQASIIHVSADFPDRFQPAKTRAIESLVRLVDDRFAQQIYSLNRCPPGAALLAAVLTNPWRPRLAIDAEAAHDGVIAVRYRAPGKGLYHAGVLVRLGDWLANRLAAGPRPGLLVGHKLSVEAIAVAQAARRLGVPYALSIQGDSDLKILSARRDLRGHFARVFHGAAMVFHFAPWALARVEARLGRRHGPSTLVPCPVSNAQIMPPRAGGDGLVSVFHLQSHRRKNLARMAAASDIAARAVPGLRLAVVGGGTPAQRAACERVVAGHACGLEGALPLAAVPARLNRASGFVLPSLRESFGLVFIEALLAGAPIAYPADWAVDGYFDAAPFALRVDNRDVGSIADAMARLMRDEAALKTSLAAWQHSAAAGVFRREAIGDAFATGLCAAMCGSVQTPATGHSA